MKISTGKNRLFYKATNFQVNINVTARLILPDLTDIVVNLNEIGDGIYYFDYEFDKEEKYGLIIKENGIPKVFEPLVVVDKMYLGLIHYIV